MKRLRGTPGPNGNPFLIVGKVPKKIKAYDQFEIFRLASPAYFSYNAVMNRLLKTAFALWLRVRSFLNNLLSKPASFPGPLFLKGDKNQLPFLEGANLPWLNYGGDFGSSAWSPNGGVGRPESRENLYRIFLELNERGIHTVRWFLFCDGRAGIRFSAAGTPIGPDQFIFTDLDAALEIASACNLKIIFVLLDFLWFAKADQVNGVRVRGRGNVISGVYRQLSLRRKVLKPLLKRYGRSPVILAWDIVNEPEWVTRGFGGSIAGTAVAFLTMRGFIKKTARLVHRHTRQLATVGLANASGLPLVRYTGLDFYQVHWYDQWDTVAPLERPVPEWNLDRPLLLGEFPTKNSARSPQAIIDASRQSGYCGALAWSVLGTDHASGIDLGGQAALLLNRAQASPPPLSPPRNPSRY